MHGIPVMCTTKSTSGDALNLPKQPTTFPPPFIRRKRPVSSGEQSLLTGVWENREQGNPKHPPPFYRLNHWG